jgi:hypothetical protein
MLQLVTVASLRLLQLTVNKRSVNGVLKLVIRQYATGMVVFCIERRWLSIGRR